MASWRPILPLAVFLCICSQPCLCQEPEDEVKGEGRNEVLNALLDMCDQSQHRYFHRMQTRPSLAQTWLSEALQIPQEQIVSTYFYLKPVHTRRNSICAPMNTTCCKPRTEKHIARMTIKEYGELFMNVTEENVGNCFTVGRHFYHAMYSNFKEIRRQLEIPIKIQLDDKMPEDLFSDFFQYLSSFSVVSDLCDLPLELNAIMSKIFDFIYDVQPGESLRESHSKCYQNVSVQLMSETYERLFNGLERQMYNLDLILRSMQMSEIVLERLKRHRFSTECTKPLTQLFNCAQCTGYFLFKPCLFYCMNVLRGCFADIADLHKEFRLMTKALSDIPDDILGTFQPDIFIKDSLTHFINLVDDLKSRNLKSEVSTACTGEVITVKRKRSGYFRRQSPAFSTVAPSDATQEEDRLTAAFNQEFQCMEKIGSFLGNVPEEMCYQSKEHPTIADSGNHRCWLGSSFGTYYHPQVGFSKEDQVNNPEFRNSPHPPYLNQFNDLSMEISMIAAEINETLDLVLCLDDEDCTTAPFYVCDTESLVSGSGSGSGDLGSERKGSASGSGLGSGTPGDDDVGDDGLRDMEDGDTDTGVIVSTPKSLDTPTPYSTPHNATDTEETPTTAEEDTYEVIDISNSSPTNDSAPSSLPTTDSAPSSLPTTSGEREGNTSLEDAAGNTTSEPTTGSGDIATLLPDIEDVGGNQETEKDLDVVLTSDPSSANLVSSAPFLSAVGVFLLLFLM